ncbi:hypothetical protein AURDEDRAFT_171590 [Auricularia subglabra TFB-10046 SS5]|nr:hypothetical protein AURDEDRAFT_171590 [Auricularia subglabra TFB-10046 SS5]
MSVIDFPGKMRDTPPLGTFVVIALNPENSLAALDDPAVETAARRLKPGRRVVMVDMGGGVETFTRQMYRMWLHVDSNKSSSVTSSLQGEIDQLYAYLRARVACHQ